MSIAAQGSFREIKLNEIPLKGKVVNFYYYESLLSPHITANFTYVDTGATAIADKNNDVQSRIGTLSSAIPEMGNQTVSFVFENSLGKLDFTRYNLKVDRNAILAQESQRESVFVRLTSPIADQNEKNRVMGKFYNNIGDNARKIIQNNLLVKSDRIKLDQTRNSYAFTGSNRKPCDVLLDLAFSSIPTQGSPGFFFYETKSGIHFKSIDNLISQQPKETYFYNQTFRSELETDGNYRRILQIPSKNNQGLLKSLESGMYSARFNFMVIGGSEMMEERVYNIDDFKQKTLGRPFRFDRNLKSSPSRVYNVFIPIGMMEKGIKNVYNNDPREFLPKAIMRYNLLFAQRMDILIPCNPNLEAGDVIKCEFDKITMGDKALGSTDQNQSGKYLILNLCHYYGTTTSYTALTLVRDTYGEYTGAS
jgi:hypothetical protein